MQCVGVFHPTGNRDATMNLDLFEAMLNRNRTQGENSVILKITNPERYLLDDGCLIGPHDLRMHVVGVLTDELATVRINCMAGLAAIERCRKGLTENPIEPKPAPLRVDHGISISQLVYDAIASGAKTQAEIKAITRLTTPRINGALGALKKAGRIYRERGFTLRIVEQ